MLSKLQLRQRTECRSYNFDTTYTQHIATSFMSIRNRKVHNDLLLEEKAVINLYLSSVLFIIIIIIAVAAVSVKLALEEDKIID